jgi:histidinol dehydrogenase
MIRLDTADPGFAAAFAALLRQAGETTEDVAGVVADILRAVRDGGDAALCALTERFDRMAITPDRLRVGTAEIAAAEAAVAPDLLAALDLAAARIEAFHRAQMPADLRIDDPAGLAIGLRWTAIASVGLYVPGGTAAYPSSVLMNALPARVAGVERVVMTVPTPDGVLNPLVLAAARRAGVTEIFRVGGAQAIAALAHGTAAIAPVDRIVGPGNRYVAEAKRQVFGRVGIDSVAGPSEVLILADASAPADWVAIDLLAQAEHDAVAQAILVTPSAALADAVAARVAALLPTLPRADIATASWSGRGAIIVTRDLTEAISLSDRIAPEHLQIMTADPDAVFRRTRHAGSAFLGPHSPTALGDYVAGPNHVLPTGGSARFSSGLSVFDFLKRTTWTRATAAGIAAIGPAGMRLAEAEGLPAHRLSIARRLA